MTRGRSAIALFSAIVMASAACAVLFSVHEFGQGRFFTIDEYQWGHATWLVSQGELPYRDFYEHHLPLGYTLHAPFVMAGSFEERALRLRLISFAYLAIGSALAALATWRARRSTTEGLAVLALAPAFGFSLMSAIDYRGDNWAAFTLLGVFSVLELNRHRARPWVAAGAGVGLVAAGLMTQKIVVLGAFAVVPMLLIPWIDRVRGLPETAHPPLIAAPAAFVSGALAAAVAALAVAVALGILDEAIEINWLQALRHEALYPGFEVGRYWSPFIADTWPSTAPIALLALAYAFGDWRRFWVLPLAFAALGGLLVKAPFPYNFVFLCFVGVLCAVRGLGYLLERILPAGRAGHRFAPLGYLVLLATLPSQLGFVAGTLSNEHQLHLLRRIEENSSAQDVVIDSAGSALFRPDRGYYWYQGRAHVKMFREYFEEQLVDDLRASRAPFWIRSIRARQLPRRTKRYLESHYVPFDGQLHVLGFRTPAGRGTTPRTFEADVVRGGEYYIGLDPGVANEGARGGSSAEVTPAPGHLEIDGVPVSRDRVHLEEGVHTIVIDPRAPSYRFALLPNDRFGDLRRGPHHTPMFEYDNAPCRRREAARPAAERQVGACGELLPDLGRL